MTKDEALKHYAGACKLRYLSPEEDWRDVFPDRDSLRKFWEDVKDLRWPENWGSSPWEAASDVASDLSQGMSDHTAHCKVKWACSEGKPHDMAFLRLFLAYRPNEADYFTLLEAIGNQWNSLPQGRECDEERERLADLRNLIDDSYEQLKQDNL